MVIAGCQTSALNAFHDHEQLRFMHVYGGPFRHQLVLNEPAVAQHSAARPIHVYIEGDGRPWYRPHQVAWDPSPQHALMLELMVMDASPAIYLGRPCYFALEDSACSAIWWTHQRYAPEVVASMGRALDKVIAPGDTLVLMGHSGGGALAMLLAAHRTDVLAVVTLAGNLDSAAWAEWHGYSPLAGSLNPQDFPLPSSVPQWHYAGSNDHIMPVSLIEDGVQQGGQVEVLEGADHHCCWRAHWPRILREIEREVRKIPAGP